MATLNLTPDEIVAHNERFNDLMKDFKGKGLKAPLSQYYMRSNSETRLNYKRIKDIFDGTTNSIQQIRIGPEKEVKPMSVTGREPEKETLGAKLKKAGKKILKKLIGQGPESLSADERLLLVEWMESLNDDEGGEII